MRNRLSFALFVTLPTMSHAALVGVDWKTTNDQLLTYDNQTSLYWLDTRYTASISNNFDIVKARTKDKSDELNGFRHATLEEVNTLFTNGGLHVTLEGTKWESGSDATPNQTQSFLQMLGETFSVGNDPTKESRIFGYTSTTCSEITSTRCSTGTEVVISSVGLDWLDRTFATLVWNHADKKVDYPPNTGHFLLTSSPPAPVPLPAAGWFFLTGIAGLIFTRFRQS